MTTDHISPAGAIPPGEPAGRWLQANGVPPIRFNNLRLPARQPRGDDARHLRQCAAPQPDARWPRGRATRCICQAARRRRSSGPAKRYRASGTPLVVIAGREYGTGSSRDWAAKGTYLLGVRAVIAESYERIQPLEPGGDGRAPAPVRRGAGRPAPRPDRLRGVRHCRDIRGAGARSGAGRPRDPKRRVRWRSSASRPASTPRSMSSTTGTAASCTRCFGSWLPGRARRLSATEHGRASQTDPERGA